MFTRLTSNIRHAYAGRRAVWGLPAVRRQAAAAACTPCSPRLRTLVSSGPAGRTGWAPGLPPPLAAWRRAAAAKAVGIIASLGRLSSCGVLRVRPAARGGGGGNGLCACACADLGACGARRCPSRFGRVRPPQRVPLHSGQLRPIHQCGACRRHPVDANSALPLSNGAGTPCHTPVGWQWAPLCESCDSTPHTRRNGWRTHQALDFGTQVRRQAAG